MNIGEYLMMKYKDMVKELQAMYPGEDVPIKMNDPGQILMFFNTFFKDVEEDKYSDTLLGLMRRGGTDKTDEELQPITERATKFLKLVAKVNKI